MIGRTLAHYRITAALGAGGMGEVFRATDTKLGREVALKVLPATVAQDPERLDRFQREAKALAALDHPGIVTVYAVEEAEGVHFLTMQLVEGAPLDRLIPGEGLPFERWLTIATGIAEALAVAHEKGIVHRDLKPANVMVAADGRVKILDFGLAKMAEPPSGDTVDPNLPTIALTQEGVVMGTVPYMSPEQVRGQRVDERSDLFSLGAILYEMACGRRPFRADSSADLMSAIVRDAPEPLSTSRADLPPAVERMVKRALAKDPSRRFQTARGLLAELLDLRDEVSGSTEPPAPGAGAAPPTPSSGSAPAGERFWIAVLPFAFRGTDPGLEALAEGISEEIVTGLSRFSYLRVIARSSTLRYAGQAVDVRAVGRELGARYVMEGSLRQAGSRVRIAAQLVDAVTGAHLWAESYDRPYSPEAVFDLQDEVAPTIVSTVADMNGVLPHAMSEALRGKDPDELTPYEAVLRSFGYVARLDAEEHALVRSALERAVREAPGDADGWAMLSYVFAEEHKHDFNVLPESLDRALDAARRAVAAAPSNHLGYHMLAQALFFRRELPAFKNAAERAIALNPMDGCTVAFMGILLAYAGDWERGCELTKRAMKLNPNHPGWYRFALFNDAYRRHDYREAVEVALQFNMPSYFYTHMAIAASHAQLGEHAAAERALAELLAQKPDFAAVARPELGKWYIDPKLLDEILDGLRKAGLETSDEVAATTTGAPPTRSAAPGSGAARAESGFWIAVLPFQHPGGEAPLAALATGMSEEITTGLSRFSYLRVIARSSTLGYSGQAVDVRAVGRELGARYVMEGSIRQAGARVRIAAQLVDANTGAHLWAESFDRPFAPDSIFELQDDVVPRIVSTVADMNGVLPRSMSETVRGLDPEQLSPYEAVLRSFGYPQRVTAEELAAAKLGLERAVQTEPNYADAWAMLAFLYLQDFGQGFGLHPDPLKAGLAAARRAVEAAPSNPLAHWGLAQAFFFRKEFPSFRNAAERAAALNPLDGNSIAFLGELMTYAGDRERGLELAARAKQLNPNHPGWYWYIDFYDAFRQGDYRGAVGFVLKANLPGHWGMHAALAAAYGHLGERSAAAKAVEDLLRVRPDFRASVRRDFEKWWEPAYVDRMIDGWRKAGLEIATTPGKGAPSTTESAAVAIAVLPFSDLSPGRDQEYLCEGMADEIMNALVGIDGLRVASRTSAFRVAREGREMDEISRLLSVGNVLEGSVRTAGDRLRVTAQLTDLASGYQLWSQRYDRATEDVFAVQDEIAAGVVEAVRARLAPGAKAAPSRRQVENLDAYRAYLRGRHLRYTNNDHRGALACFEEAVGIDPRHAPSWLGLAEVHVLAAIYGLSGAAEEHALAKQALATAEGLLGETAETSYVAGAIALAEYRFDEAERALRRAHELKPDYVEAACWVGMCLAILGRFGEVEAHLEHACEIDPLAPYPYAMLACCRVLDGEPAAAETAVDQALAFDGRHTLGLWVRGNALGALGRLDEAVASFERAVAASQRGGMVHGMLGWAYAAAGRPDDARGVLAELASRPAGAPTVVPEAWIRAELGDVDGAWAVLDCAVEEGQFVAMMTALPGFDPLRGHPRFEQLLARLGLPPAASS